MPFGAELTADGTRFRFWAPGQSAVSVVIEGVPTPLPMTPSGQGWFELTTAQAEAGSRYRYRLADGARVPDPASRFQPDDVHGPSQVIDPLAYAWRTGGWQGRPWHEAVLYELHLGTFSEQGGYDGVLRRLDHLAAHGITALELMPLGDFPGRRGWGYDGVYWYAPDAAYGTPEQLKALIDAAHERELMVFLDVVYNHFGPEGNYLARYAPGFFTEDRHTPWGAAIDYRQRPVRDFALHNVLYWLEEYRFDGLRLDAVHAIEDLSETPILAEIAATVRARFGDERQVHLVLENDANEAGLLARDEAGRPRLYEAQWNDDWHHAAHHLLTGERSGYYADYAEEPQAGIARALGTGYVFQGEPSAFRDGARRGTPSGHLPPTAFVNFIQNHDQIGNRAFGERIAALAPPEAVQAMQAVLLLAPSIPLIFMGGEWGAREPFCFFTDFHDELAEAVRAGRRKEFARFPEFADAEARERIPDPNDPATMAASRLDWAKLEQPEHANWLRFTRALLAVRRQAIWPLMPKIGGEAGRARSFGHAAFEVTWQAGDAGKLRLIANLAMTALDGVSGEGGTVLWEQPAGMREDLGRNRLPAWSVLWLLDPAA